MQWIEYVVSFVREVKMTEQAKKDLTQALVEEKLDFPYQSAHNFNLDGELMVEITLDEYRSLVAENARLKAELLFSKGSARDG